MADDIQELRLDFLSGTLQPVQEEEVSEEDEEPSEDEMLEEELEPLFDGPPTWEEVNITELDQITLKVTSAAVPSTDNKELGSRLAMQAAALEADNSDPLGLGRIDPRHLSLVRVEESQKAWRQGRLSDSRRETGRRKTLAEQERIAALVAAKQRPSLLTGSNLAELRAKALPTSDAFEAEIFLGTVHSATTMPDLLKGRSNLKNEVSERTGQLKALVKENFDRFISCKNTIDDIHKRLRKSEAHDSLSASGNSTADMVIAISEVQDEGKRAFATLLERASKSDQVKSVVALLKRYEGLFQLPSRIRQSTARKEYDQVISEYRKARALIAGMGTHNSNGVWHSLFTEVDKGVEQMARQLDAVLRNPNTSRAQAIDVIRQVLLLQAENAPATRGMEPAMLYFKTREKELRERLDACTDAHTARLRSLRGQSNGQEGTANGWHTSSQSGDLDSPAMLAIPWQHKQSESSLWLEFVKQLMSLATDLLPDFWSFTQDKLNQLKAIPKAQSVVLGAVDVSLAIGKDMLVSFSKKLHLAMRELANHERERSFFLAALHEIVSGFVHFRSTNPPSFVAVILQELLEAASSLCIHQMVARHKKMMARMVELEDFEIIASSHKAGHPASKVPGMMREVLSTGMQQLESVLEEGERADTDDQVFNAIGNSAGLLRHSFFECFSGYAVATDQLWTGITSRADAPSRGGISSDSKLLVLHSNCVHVRTHVLKDLVARYKELLQLGGGARESHELLGECVEDIKAVEGRLAGLYIESRMDLLNDMLDEYFEDDGTVWSAAPLPTGLRDCAYETLNTIVAVEAEVYSNALSLQKRVMDDLLQHLFAAYNTCLSEKLPGISAGGALQLLLELQYFTKALEKMLRHPRDKLAEEAKQMLVRKIDELAQDEGSSEAQDLEDFCEEIQGGGMGGRAEMIGGFLIADFLKQTHLNVVSFR